MTQWLGDEYDKLPIMNAVGYPQNIQMDVRNHMGKGHTSLWISPPKNNYHLFVSPSLTEWLKNHTYNLENNFI
jgi:hypothetical protein